MDIMKLHFDRRLALATGLASAGAGAGTVGLTKLLEWVAVHGLGSAFLCMAATMVPGLVASLALTPPPAPTLSTSPCPGQDGPPSLAELRGRYTSLLSSPPALLYLLGRFLLTASYAAYFAFEVDEAQLGFGLSREEAGTVLALSGAAALAGKVVDPPADTLI